ncbi:hypothetical protein GCM10022419_020520 [Nonomuraea rosea]|uniref:Uncharacterized protein n=1 Tax=Nonomuraea rosea TaxID=638574 RepID=A0ABP6VXA7_9ACTN
MVLAKEIPEAAAKLGAALEIASRHSSAQLTDEIRQTRARLEPWADTTYVRRLDEALQSCGVGR